MLTKNDLDKFKKIVRNEVEIEGNNIREHLDAEIKLSRMRLSHQLRELSIRIKNLEIKTSGIEKGTKIIKTDLKRTINYFDRRDSEATTSVRDIQSHLELPLIDFA